MTAADKKKIISNLPFLIFFWIFDKLSYAVRLSEENILISVVKGVSSLQKRRCSLFILPIFPSELSEH